MAKWPLVHRKQRNPSAWSCTMLGKRKLIHRSDDEDTVESTKPKRRVSRAKPKEVVDLDNDLDGFIVDDEKAVSEFNRPGRRGGGIASEARTQIQSSHGRQEGGKEKGLRKLPAEVARSRTRSSSTWQQAYSRRKTGLSGRSRFRAHGTERESHA